MNFRTAIAVLLACALSVPAAAQMRTKVTSLTVAQTPVCIDPYESRETLSIDVSAASARIGYCMGTCTPLIGVGGTTVIPVGGGPDFWPRGSAPTGSICLAAETGSQPVTIIEGFQ